MVENPKAEFQKRREFLSVLGASAAGLAVGACGKCTTGKRSTGVATNAAITAKVVPSHLPLSLIEPDVPGKGLIPDAFLSYPKQEFVRAIRNKPGRGGNPITTMSAVWSPTPPGLGRNSFLDAVNAELGVTLQPTLQDGWNFGSKLSALLGARDVPDVLSAPSWEVNAVPRFSQAVVALFQDLTGYLAGDAVKEYRMLGTLPTGAWQHCVWGERLAAIPYPTDSPFSWVMFYRKDISDKRGVEPPGSIDELYRFGQKVTAPSKGVWAFGNTFEMIQMYFKVPSDEGGWRKKAGGGLEFKYETQEYRAALEFTARLFKEGLVHPDIVASDAGADEQQLFKSGRITMYRDGIGGWFSMQRDQAKITPGFNMQPLPLFSAVGGKPVAWGGAGVPIYYTFLKKGLGEARVREILRVLNWCAAPLGSKEYELNKHGVEGKHFTRAEDGSPIATDLGRREIADQYRVIGGRVPALVGGAEVPTYVPDWLRYTEATARYIKPSLFEGIKLELPASYAKLLVVTEDKVSDIVRGRRPISDLDQIVAEWRRAGGDDGRAFFEKVLADNGR